jgi:hypothetical protein
VYTNLIIGEYLDEFLQQRQQPLWKQGNRETKAVPNAFGKEVEIKG